MPQLIEVLEFFDNSGNIMFKRLPESDNTEIKWGAQLTVRESQKAIFIKEGKIKKVFDAGRYILDTKNIPVLTKLVTGVVYGKDSPFRAEVYFVNLKLFRDYKWGTSEPIIFRDAEFDMIRLRANGNYSVEIINHELFLNRIVGTQGLFHSREVESHLRSVILTSFAKILGDELDTVFNLPKRYVELAYMLKKNVQKEFNNLGLNLYDFHINSISVPPEVQKSIDSRSGMKAVGDLNNFLKFKTAKSLENERGNSSNQGIEAGVGIGLGISMSKALSNNDNDNGKLFEKLKNLKELLDLGAISTKEFEIIKEKIIRKF